MLNFIMEGGPFMMLLLILAIIIIVLSIRRIIELYVKKDLNSGVGWLEKVDSDRLSEIK